MMARLLLTLAIIGSATLSTAEAVEPPLIVEYPYLTLDERAITVRYGADGTSVLETHERDQAPGIDPSNDTSPYLPGERIAGPMTDFRSGMLQHWDDEIGTNFIEVRQSPRLEENVRYADDRLTPASQRPNQPSWSISGFSVTLSRGSKGRTIQGLETDHWIVSLSYTRTAFDADGAERDRETKTTNAEVWTSEALPFSPLPLAYEPLVGNRVPPYLSGPLGEYFVFELADALRERGGLVRAAIESDGETHAMELSDIRETPDLPMKKFDSLPVVAAEQVNRFSGPLFLTSLLRDDMMRAEADATVVIDGRTLTAVSEWKQNDAGDLVIAISAREENSTFFLVRPLQGIPEPGEYAATLTPESSRLGQMSEAEMEAHTRDFQLFGIVAGETLPTVITGFDTGTVTIEATDNDVIRGNLDGRVLGLPTATVADPEPMTISVVFDATEGLDTFRFKSNESRYSRR